MKIIRINAMWCGGCLVMKTRWQHIMKSYPNLDITDYDYDLDSEAIAKFNIGKVIPVVIFLDDNNEEISRVIGEVKESELIDIIEKGGKK